MDTSKSKMAKLRGKEISSIRGVKYKKLESTNYDDFINGTPAEKVKILDLRPDIALGPAAGKEFEEVQFRIGALIVSSLIVAILTTVAYTTFDEDNANKQYLVAAFSISWFLFISFIFLLFNATRLLHIIFFIVVLALISAVYDHLEKENKQGTTKNIITATEVFIGAIIIVLLYYYLVSRKEEELIELRDSQKLREFNNYTKELVTKARELERSKLEKEFEKKYEAKKSEKSSSKKKDDD